MPTIPPSHRATKLAIYIGADAHRLVRTMLDRQNLTDMAVSVREIPGGAIGCLGVASLPLQGNVCFFTGLPINGPDVEQLSDADAAAQVLPQWDGAFVGVFWDAGRQVLVIATDCLGMQPLYIRQDGDQLTLVSETKALSGEPDLAAWGAFISIGHPIGDRSLMHGLRRAPPASVLVYGCACRKLDVHRYWHWPDPSDNWRKFDFLAALEQDIRAYAALGEAGTLLLSGGFDSRLLLGLLLRAPVPVDALIVAHADEHGDADGRIAERVARVAGVPYRKAHPHRDFFSSEDYLDYLRASDVGFPSLGLFIAKVASQIRSKAVWDGLVPGFVFMPLHQPVGGFDAYLEQEIDARDSANWRAARILFRKEVVDEMYEGFVDDLRKQVEHLSREAHGLLRLVIENRSRNRAAMNPLKVYSSQTNAFTPGVSKAFITHAATIPFHEKQGGAFYRQLFQQLDPRLSAVPFLSGGNLVRGNGDTWGYRRERMRVRFEGFRTRHPSLFPGVRPAPSVRFAFLGEHQSEGGDSWLNRGLRETLTTAEPNNDAAWALLFHWKAWQWVHDGRLDAMPTPSAVTSPVCHDNPG